MTPDSAFEMLVNTLSAEPGISFGEGRGFGSRALKSDGKIFAMVARHGKLVMKLPRARVEALIADAVGTAFVAGHGRAMKEWIEFDVTPANLIALGREAAKYVRSG